MMRKSSLRFVIGFAGAMLLVAATPDAHAGCSDPAGMEVDWHECDLKGADLPYKILSGSNLSKADFSGANLEGVVFIQADLTGANLSGANLSSADLRDAILKGANLSEADVSDVDLTGTDLSGAIWTDGQTCAEGSIGECK